MESSSDSKSSQSDDEYASSVALANWSSDADWLEWFNLCVEDIFHDAMYNSTPFFSGSCWQWRSKWSSLVL